MKSAVNMSFRWIKVVMVMALLVMLAGGAWFYRVQEQAIREKVEEDLSAIARLKVNQIAAWRKAQLDDAAAIQDNPFLSKSVARFMADPSEENRQDLRVRFRSLAGQNSYADILLVNPSGKALLSMVEPAGHYRGYALALAEALRGRRPAFTDIHTKIQGASPHISVVAPLYTGSGKTGPPRAALILVSNASQFLYPLIRFWPTPSKTAETFLVRRDGNDVLFLSNLRHQPDTALKLRIPLTRTDVLAVKAVLKGKGVVLGKDYRGVEVVSVILPIPDSPWFMISKVSAGEAFADWRFRSVLMLMLLVGLTFFMGAAGLALWQRDKQNHYRALYLSEAALRANVERHSVMLKAIGDAVIATDAQGLVELVNPVAEDLTGWKQDEARGRPLEEIFYIIDEVTREKVEDPAAKVLREGRVVGLANHTILITRDGAEHPIADSGAPIRSEGGEITGVVLVFRDQTDERAAQEALRKSEQLYHRTLDGMMEGCQIIGSDWRYVYINAAAEFHNKRPKEELLGNRYMDMWPGIEETEVFNRIRRCMEERVSEDMENLFVFPDGSKGWFELIIQPVPEGVFILSMDITHRKRAEEKLRHSTDVLRALRNVNQLITHEKDPHVLLRRACDILIETRGYSSAWIGMLDGADGLRAKAESGLGEEFNTIRAELERGAWPECCRQALDRPGIVVVPDMDVTCRKCPMVHTYHDTAALTGALRHGNRDYGVLVVALPEEVSDDAEEQSLFKELCQDIGFALYGIEADKDREQAETALRESEARYRALFEASADGILIIDIEAGRFRYANPAMRRLLGYSEAEFLTMGVADLHPKDDLPKVMADFEAQIRGVKTLAKDIPCLRKDGVIVFTDVNATPIFVDGRTCSAGFFRDVTERRRAEEEREKLQAQLIQAQKMESVGRLAGGVAHDYNNILNVIIGYSELALDQVGQKDPLHDYLKEIYSAALRSRDITRQLLAFARKETIAPEVLDLNTSVEGMLKILRRLIGEDIDLVWHPGRGLWPVLMDPTQIDQMLANLCVNARDAIADVGKITIETGTKTFDAAYCSEHAGTVPGDFVLLSISDDGCGMDHETLDKIFEPFFTTKGLGRGTGLGLATVYGIVKQNNGFINVYSEPGQGTTFGIYLPRHAGDIAEDRGQTVEKTPKGRGETLLVVEDDISILHLVERVLTKQNYKILITQNPVEALESAEAHPGEIALLITDVVMPEMNGRELAEKMQAICPKLRCLFMSGYTADVIAHRGVLDKGVRFIQKPFSARDLAVKVRTVLDEPVAGISE